MNKRFIISALLIAAFAVACDSKSDDPQPTLPEPTPSVPVVPSDSIPESPLPSDSIPATPGDPDPTTPIDPDPTTPIDPDPTAPIDPEPTTPIVPAGDSITSSIGSMTGVDFVLGPIPMEIKGTLEYALTCAARNYSQGTWTLPKSEVCELLGVTEEDFDARKEVTIVCLSMNKDWSAGDPTANGKYGGWYGNSGLAAWGSSSIAYIEGDDMFTYVYGMHPDNKSNSCVCRLQFQDKENEVAVNVEVTVSLKQ